MDWLQSQTSSESINIYVNICCDLQVKTPVGIYMWLYMGSTKVHEVDNVNDL